MAAAILFAPRGEAAVAVGCLLLSAPGEAARAACELRVEEDMRGLAGDAARGLDAPARDSRGVSTFAVCGRSKSAVLAPAAILLPRLPVLQNTGDLVAAACLRPHPAGPGHT